MVTTDSRDRKAEIARDLESGRAQLMGVISRLEESDWKRETANPDWTVRDVIAHVASGETTIQGLLQRLSRGEGGVPDDFDLDRYNASQLRRRAERTIPEILGELRAARAQTLALLAEVSPEALDQRGRHARGMEVSLEEAFRIIALHDREHAEDIRPPAARP